MNLAFFVCLWTCCASIFTQTRRVAAPWHDLELSRRTGADATLGGKPAARGVAGTLIFAASVPVHTEATHSRRQKEKSVPLLRLRSDLADWTAAGMPESTVAGAAHKLRR